MLARPQEPSPLFGIDGGLASRSVTVAVVGMILALALFRHRSRPDCTGRPARSSCAR